MSRIFLTGIDLKQNELLNAKIQNAADNPGTPVEGQIYYNITDHTLRYYNGSAWLTLAQGGSVSEAITAAIDAITTSVIEEGTNLYYTEARAKTDAAELLVGATKNNITITGDGSGLTITAENGVADSTTDDLEEGTTNLYFTDQRAIDAVGGSATSLNTPNTVVKRDGNGAFAAGTISTTGVNVQDAGSIFEDSSLIIQSNTGYPILVQGNQDVTIQSTSGDIILDADGDVYKGGAATAGNELITQNRLDQYIGDATVNGSTGNTIKDRIDTAVSDLVSGAPELLDTLNELAAAINDDASFSTTITTSIGTKVAKSGDTMTGALTLHADPTSDLHAATKQYVDTEITDAIAAFRYTVTNPEITISGGIATWTVTHNLGKRSVLVQVFEAGDDYEQIEVDVLRTSTSVVTLKWAASATVTAGTYQVIVIG